jgi:integrase
MKSRTFCSFSPLFLASPLCAREKSDVLVMRNGDRLTCEDKSLEADTLSISLDYAAGIANFHWHDLRHTFASRLRQSDTPLGNIAELMGHKG